MDEKTFVWNNVKGFLQGKGAKCVNSRVSISKESIIVVATINATENASGDCLWENTQKQFVL